MRATGILAAVLIVCLAAPRAAAQPGGRATPIPEGAECPPGMTEVRPRLCQPPTLPAPSIVDYRPRSTLVVAAHPVPKPKVPAIDFHGHPGPQVASAEALEAFGPVLDGIGLRMMVVANNVSGEALTRGVALVRASPTMRDRVRFLTGIDFRDVGPGWAERAVRQLEADAAAGAVGVGEVGKGFGLSIRKADGTRLAIDDPILDPVWRACARLRLPVFLHTADPQEFWQPIDATNERWLELALFPGRRYPADQYPAFEQLMAERDRLLARHPATTFVLAHLGWHANDLARLGRLFDAHPNVVSEVGAVLYDLGRQPRAARDFLVRYQDRVLFGKDSFQPEEYPYYWRTFETTDDYFDYYRPYHAFWKLYGLGLPDAVLEKLYARNALRIAPRIDLR